MRATTGTNAKSAHIPTSPSSKIHLTSGVQARNFTEEALVSNDGRVRVKTVLDYDDNKTA
ncbi:MAG: hypothetical protein ACYCSF_14315 [Acidimicrobiales bacterium]